MQSPYSTSIERTDNVKCVLFITTKAIPFTLNYKNIQTCKLLDALIKLIQWYLHAIIHRQSSLHRLRDNVKCALFCTLYISIMLRPECKDKY